MSKIPHKKTPHYQTSKRTIEITILHTPTNLLIKNKHQITDLLLIYESRFRYRAYSTHFNINIGEYTKMQQEVLSACMQNQNVIAKQSKIDTISK